MNEEEMAEFITREPVVWHIWMKGYEAGLSRGHQDERAGMDDLADLIARRKIVLEHCQDQIKENRVRTPMTAEVAQARSRTRIGANTGGPVLWDEDAHE